MREENTMKKIIKTIFKIADHTTNFQENFIDIRIVADFTMDCDGLYLYMKDGTGYYLER